MKKIICLLIGLLFITNIYSQDKASFGWNTCFGAGAGYQYIYNEQLHDSFKPKHMISVDLNFLGIYLGFGYGRNTFYSEQHGWYETYSESINVYSYKIGPSIKIGNSKFRTVLTPYVGMLQYKFGELYSDYYCYEKERLYETRYIYGGKISLIYNSVEIGAYASNYECGVNIGFNMSLF